MFCNIFSIPFCPPAPKANKYPLPKLHAFAPKDNAFNTWVPLLTPPSKITSILSPTAFTISASWSKGALEPSSCLPPWFEIIIAVHPISIAL